MLVITPTYFGRPWWYHFAIRNRESRSLYESPGAKILSFRATGFVLTKLAKLRNFDSLGGRSVFDVLLSVKLMEEYPLDSFPRLWQLWPFWLWFEDAEKWRAEESFSRLNDRRRVLDRFWPIDKSFSRRRSALRSISRITRRSRSSAKLLMAESKKCKF